MRRGDVLVPNRQAESGWAPNTLMGRYLAGLVAWGAERDAEPDMQPARLTVDMFRPPMMGSTRVETAIVRSGRRIRVVDAEVEVDGVVVCRGNVVFLRRGESPDGQRWVPEPSMLPSPEGLEPMTKAGIALPWDQRTVGSWGVPGKQRTLWVTETERFIDGEPLSPFVRVALAADSANGTLNAGADGLGFINADLTMTLGALPRGVWIGLEPVSRVEADGIGVGVVDVYDGDRRIGQVSMTALADGRQIGRGIRFRS